MAAGQWIEAPPPAGIVRPGESLLASAGGDTLLLATERIEDLEMEVKLGLIRENVLKNQVEDLKPNTLEKILGDPRLWFIVGAWAGIQVAK